MKKTSIILLGFAAMILVSCSTKILESKKEENISPEFVFRPSYSEERMVLTSILDVKVSAVVTLPGGEEVVVKNFETPPSYIIEGNTILQLSDSSKIELGLPIKLIAHITFHDGNGLKVLELPYLMQKKGDLVDICCGNSFSFAQD